MHKIFARHSTFVLLLHLNHGERRFGAIFYAELCHTLFTILGNILNILQLVFNVSKVDACLAGYT